MDFNKLMEAKIDMNVKIAKLISNAIGWNIDFSDLKEGRASLFIASKKYLLAGETA
jgi:hypothetical protein